MNAAMLFYFHTTSLVWLPVVLFTAWSQETWKRVFISSLSLQLIIRKRQGRNSKHESGGMKAWSEGRSTESIISPWKWSFYSFFLFYSVLHEKKPRISKWKLRWLKYSKLYIGNTIRKTSTLSIAGKSGTFSSDRPMENMNIL